MPLRTLLTVALVLVLLSAPLATARTGGGGDDIIRSSWTGRDRIDCGSGRDTVYYRPGRTVPRNCETKKRLY